MGVTVAAETRELDGLVPRETVAARRESDVVDTLRAASAERSAVVLWGGGTRIEIGSPLERYDVALDMRALSGIVDHQPDDLTVTVRAGTTVAELAEALARHGQWWPVEVGGSERATVGGTIASAASGASRYRYGHPRDRVIGARAVLGDGTAVHSGGRVVKNVSGYDLSRTWCGSFGTLAAITEISLKLLPLPPVRVTLRADLPDPTFAYTQLRVLLRERLPFDALAVGSGERASLGSPTWTSAFIRLAGTAAAVERLRAAVSRVLGPVQEVDGAIWQRIADLPVTSPSVMRGTWPPGEPVDVYPANAVWYAGVEMVLALDEPDPDDVTELRSAAEGRGGALVLEKAPLDLRRALGVWGTPRTPPEVAARLRQRFDPQGVLAPGRMP